MIAEMQIHTIARQMLQKHGPQASAQAAQNAVRVASYRGRHEDDARTASELTAQLALPDRNEPGAARWTI